MRSLIFPKPIFDTDSKLIVAEAKPLKKEKELPRCQNCGQPIDDCKCVCPYCGETSDCTCCVGSDKVTGG